MKKGGVEYDLWRKVENGKKVARHYARMNGGEVWDRQEWKTAYNYRVEGLDY